MVLVNYSGKEINVVVRTDVGAVAPVQQDYGVVGTLLALLLHHVARFQNPTGLEPVAQQELVYGDRPQHLLDGDLDHVQRLVTAARSGRVPQEIGVQPQAQ